MFLRARIAIPTIFLAGLGAFLLLKPTAGRTDGEPQPGQRPSIVLITIEGLRWDFTRHARLHQLEAMEKDTIVFREALTPSPLSLPSHASMMTGENPPRHGLQGIVSPPLPEEKVTLAEVLRSRGYRTGAVLASPFLDRRFRLDQGFQTYNDAVGIGERGSPCAGRSPGTVTRSALEWLRDRGQDPFFLWVQYRVPGFDGRRFTASGDARGVSGRGQYATILLLLDSEIGKLFRYLRQEGLWEPLLVILAGAHGEALGEGGEIGHGPSLHEATVRVPLYLKLPAGESSATGDIDTPVSLVDLRPTILDLLEIPDNEVPDGQSLLPLLNGTGEEDRPIYFESYYPREQFGGPWLRGLRKGPYRFFLGWSPELFFLSGDGEGGEDPFIGDPARRGNLRAELEILSGEKTGSSSPPAGRGFLDPEFAGSLRACGYLEAPTRILPGAEVPSRVTVRDLHASMSRARVLLSRGEWRHAERALQEAVAVGSGQTAPLHLLGLVRWRRGKPKEAVGLLEAALNLDPTRPSLSEDLARLYLEMETLDRAVEVLESGIRNHPASVRLGTLLGETLLQRGDEAGAARAYHKVLEIHHREPSALRGLALLARRRGDMETAAGLLREVLAERPEWNRVQEEFGETLLLWGGSLVRRGDPITGRKRFFEALGEFRSLLDRDPENQAAEEGLRAALEGLREMLRYPEGLPPGNSPPPEG